MTLRPQVWGAGVSQAQVFRDVEPLLSSVADGHSACLIGVGHHASGHRAATVLGARDSEAGAAGGGGGGGGSGGDEAGSEEDDDNAVDFGIGFHAAAAVLRLVAQRHRLAVAAAEADSDPEGEVRWA